MRQNLRVRVRKLVLGEEAARLPHDQTSHFERENNYVAVKDSGATNVNQKRKSGHCGVDGAGKGLSEPAGDCKSAYKNLQSLCWNWNFIACHSGHCILLLKMASPIVFELP